MISRFVSAAANWPAVTAGRSAKLLSGSFSDYGLPRSRPRLEGRTAGQRGDLLDDAPFVGEGTDRFWRIWLVKSMANTTSMPRAGDSGIFQLHRFSPVELHCDKMVQGNIELSKCRQANLERQ